MGSWAQGTCPGAPREQGGWEGRTQVRPGSVLGTLLGPWPQPLRPLAMDSTVPDLFPKPRTSLLTPVVYGAPKSSLHSPPATSPSLHQLPPPLSLTLQVPTGLCSLRGIFHQAPTPCPPKSPAVRPGPRRPPGPGRGWLHASGTKALQ